MPQSADRSLALLVGMTREQATARHEEHEQLSQELAQLDASVRGRDGPRDYVQADVPAAQLTRWLTAHGAQGFWLHHASRQGQRWTLIASRLASSGP